LRGVGPRAQRQNASKKPPGRRIVEYLKDRMSRLLRSFRQSEMFGPALFAIAIGLGAGIAAILFRQLVDFASELLLGGGVGLLQGWLPVGATIFVVGFGGLLVGLISHFFAPETKGHGVPEVMLAVAREGGRIRPQVTLFKALSAAITIGSGGSAGREGPIVQIGAAFGSTMAQWFNLPDRRVILAVACGAAGGIAGTFNAPLAGVVFALEVVLGRFSGPFFGMVVLSSATATVVARSLGVEGDSPAFLLYHEYAMRSVPDLFIFVGLGLLCALVAQLYIRLVHGIEEAADWAPLPPYVKPAVGGALVGAMAIVTPQIMGTGYGTIEQVLNNDMELTVGLLFLLAFAKTIGTAFTVGSGGSGGIFAPSLFIGAVFGGGYGRLMQAWWPEHASPPGAYGLVGMAAVFAAAAHAPLTAIFILFEMTDNYRIIVPLMAATVAAYIASRMLSNDSIYTIKLKNRGIDLQTRPDINFMDAITVSEAMDRAVESVPPNMPLNDLMQKLSVGHETGYPVVDADEHLRGIVTMRDVEEALLGPHHADELTVSDICTKNVVVCRPDQTLAEVLSQPGVHHFGRLPVIEPGDPKHLVGILDRQAIIDAYAHAHEDATQVLPKADALRHHELQNRMVLESAVVSSGARLGDIQVRDIDFPEAATLGAVRRGRETIAPRGSTRIMPGDELIVLTTRDHLQSVRNWLRDAVS
jgi:CIC family chloride channel protein